MARKRTDIYNPSLKHLTVNNVNRYIAEWGIKAELVHGEGYFYFVGDDVNDLRDTNSVYVYRLNELSFARWMDELYDNLKGNAQDKVTDLRNWAFGRY